MTEPEQGARPEGEPEQEGPPASPDPATASDRGDAAPTEAHADDPAEENAAAEPAAPPEAEPAAAEVAEAEPAAAEVAEAEPRAADAGPAAADGAPPRARGEVLITARGLTKYYGGFTAIRDVTFSVHRGEVVAFLGPNGAGKSTTMKILTGVIAPNAGEAEIAGLPVLEHRIEVTRRLGYLPESGPLYDEMTPEGLLRFLGEARGLEPDRLRERLDVLRARLDLGSVWRKAIHKLSKGYRQRVGLAQALVHEPDVLILDEPTAGLDPNQIREVRKTVRELGRDKAVLLSTHILQEVEAVADRVVFINEGRIVFQGTVAELRSTAPDLDGAFAHHTGHAVATS